MDLKAVVDGKKACRHDRLQVMSKKPRYYAAKEYECDKCGLERSCAQPWHHCTSCREYDVCPTCMPIAQPSTDQKSSSLQPPTSAAAATRSLTDNLLFANSFQPSDETSPTATAAAATATATAASDSTAFGSNGGAMVHVRLQQRTGKKCMTIVEGLDKKCVKTSVLLNHLKRLYGVGGSISSDTTVGGDVLVLLGDVRGKVRQFLIDRDISPSNLVTVHGPTS